ncbi:MAG: hypothetical protein IKM04_03110 [Clostridia bacterium]|nr:hypothetical protein [Clostridia bacterium]
MLKQRLARWCNLKAVLIYSVVVGHLIEPHTDRSELLCALYRGIYLVHMPMFAFMSGLFLKSAEQCAAQTKRVLPIYMVLQTAAAVIGGINFFTPYWHLWYLLSTVWWCAVGYAWYRFGQGRAAPAILVLSLAIGCAVGYVPFVGRTLSFSRTVVFFPYFFAGMIFPKEARRRILMPSVPIWAAVAAVCTAFLWRVPLEFLYRAEPYKENVDALMRLLCYGVGMAGCLLAVALVPERRFFFTCVGVDTLPAYLLQCPLALIFARAELPPAAYFLLAAVFLYAVCSISRLYGSIYAIVGKRGGKGRWHPFKRYTTAVPPRCTDFFSP